MVSDVLIPSTGRVVLVGSDVDEVAAGPRTWLIGVDQEHPFSRVALPEVEAPSSMTALTEGDGQLVAVGSRPRSDHTPQFTAWVAPADVEQWEYLPDEQALDSVSGEESFESD